MVRLQQASECDCKTCVGHVSVPKGTFGGMICLCSCHKSAFNDNDLKRLEELVEGPVTHPQLSDEFLATKGLSLLARLKAAEACAKALQQYYDYDEPTLGYPALLEKWHKSAGKEMP